MSASESNPDRLSLTVRGASAVAEAVGAARSVGEARGLENQQLARLCVVIEELIANLYDHGGVTADDEVELSFATAAGGVRVSIIAPGMPFDPWSSVPGSSSPRGGRAGVNLIRAWSELVSYQPTSGANRLEILIPLTRGS